VLLELKEYATEVDVDFVRRAVRAIGRCAIKLDKATERCINTLLDLIKTKVIAAYYHEYRVLLESLLVL
jgi:AP-1 complex subunit beta-1